MLCCFGQHSQSIESLALIPPLYNGDSTISVRPSLLFKLWSNQNDTLVSSINTSNAITRSPRQVHFISNFHNNNHHIRQQLHQTLLTFSSSYSSSSPSAIG